MKLRFPALALAAILCGSGCTFHRTVINERNANLDVSGIEVGQSTYMDVIQTLGPPSSYDSPESILEASYSTRALNYAFFDSKRTGFFFRYFLFLDWRWTDARDVRELMILFDDDDHVTAIYESDSRSIWEPFGNEEDRGATTIRKIK